MRHAAVRWRTGRRHLRSEGLGARPASRVCSVGEATGGQPAGAVPALWDSLAGSRPGNRRPSGGAPAAGEVRRRRRRCGQRAPTRRRDVAAARSWCTWAVAISNARAWTGVLVSRRCSGSGLGPRRSTGMPGRYVASGLACGDVASWSRPGLPEEGVEPPHGPPSAAVESGQG